MRGFAFSSLKHQRDQMLLRRLSELIFVLKLEAQNKLGENDIDPDEAKSKRQDLLLLLQQLESSVRFLIEETSSGELVPEFAGFAKRFIDYSPDFLDRLAQTERLRAVLQVSGDLKEYHFQWLDQLQELMEAENAENVKGLFRL